MLPITPQSPTNKFDFPWALLPTKIVFASNYEIIGGVRFGGR